MSEKYDAKILENVAAEEKKVLQPDDDRLELSSGVVLKLKKVNPLRIQAVVKRFKYPPVPKTWSEEFGRDIENPDHPEYKRQKAEVDSDQMEAALEALLAFGTTLLFKPESIPAPDDPSWMEELDFFHILPEGIQKSTLARYLAWIKYVAMLDPDQDFVALGHKFNLGVSEEKVASAVDTFRSDTERDSA